MAVKRETTTALKHDAEYSADPSMRVKALWSTRLQRPHAPVFLVMKASTMKRRWILPVAVLGSSSVMKIWVGTCGIFVEGGRRENA